MTEKAVLLQASIPVRRPLVDPYHVFHSPHVPAKTRELDIAAVAEGLRTIRMLPNVEQVY